MTKLETVRHKVLFVGSFALNVNFNPMLLQSFQTPILPGAGLDCLPREAPLNPKPKAFASLMDMHVTPLILKLC